VAAKWVQHIVGRTLEYVLGPCQRRGYRGLL